MHGLAANLTAVSSVPTSAFRSGCTCRKPSAEIFTAAKCCRTCVRPVPAACGAPRRGAPSPAAFAQRRSSRAEVRA